MLKGIAALTVTLIATCASATAQAQEKEKWNAPFGGSFTATLGAVTDYSYRGISQTLREPAVQGALTYETPTFGSTPISGYVGAWGSTVYFGQTVGAVAEIDVIAGFRAKAFNDKFTADLGYIRYNYLGADYNLFLDFNEYGLVLGYDFDVVAFQAALRYSPNFFANSGRAWYKWAQATVPLPFIKVHDEVAFKLFANLGNQSVERFASYGLPRDNYWDWQVGAIVSLWGVDVSVAYTDTNVHWSECAGTPNCEARVIVGISKTF
jgi:uncharacterized protein (TIGR02001 family)